ncbi:MAG: HutD family protein [Candidatus Delongbacteria bacterium]|nr:HutD family protein [Candidatus Delongbacteria bacterium]
MRSVLRKPGDYKTVPWKNGRGTTRELAVHFGEDEERYLWRISIAGVTEDGPFSEFQDYERTLMMIEGQGIKLSHSDGTEIKLNKAYDKAEFSGDLITVAELADGSIKDFNVIVLRGRCQADVQLISEDRSYTIRGDEICFYAVIDSEFSFDNRSYSISEDHLMIFSGMSGLPVVNVKKGEMISASVRYISSDRSSQ